MKHEIGYTTEFSPKKQHTPRHALLNFPIVRVHVFVQRLYHLSLHTGTAKQSRCPLPEEDRGDDGGDDDAG